MTVCASDRDDMAPVTLHRIMQSMIGEGLKTRYEAPQKLSHELFVLLLQLKEQEKREERLAQEQKQKERSRQPEPSLGR